jgi:dTDP-4-dehydrorhamnose 3,5-epimerase
MHEGAEVSQFKIIETDVPGLLTISPQPIADGRGWFMRSFSAPEFAEAGIHQAALVQENHSRSRRGVIRGLHTRAELREAKLIRVARGEIFDVAVDLRPGSPTFLQWRSFVLDDTEHLQLRIPAGCAHGFQVLSDLADVCYKVDAPYDPKVDVTIAWDDPGLAINWPLADPVLSERDRLAPPLSAVRDHLSEWFGTDHVR